MSCLSIFIPNSSSALVPRPRQFSSRPARQSPIDEIRLRIPPNASAEGSSLRDLPDFFFGEAAKQGSRLSGLREASAGARGEWRGNQKKLPAAPGCRLRSGCRFYDGQDISHFFTKRSGGTLSSPGASTDVVAHGVGHGLLDSVRPDFFDVNFLEVGALHEGLSATTSSLSSRP